MGQRIRERSFDRKLLCISLIVGITISIFIIFGYQIENFKNVRFNEISTYLSIIILSIICTFIVATFMKITENISWHAQKERKVSLLTLGCSVTTVLFMVYFIQLLGVYPGFFNYDATGQWEMYSSGNVTAHHPVLHTLILGWIMDIIYAITGSYNKGIFCFVSLQAFITAGCFSYVITWMYRKGLSKWLLCISFIWFALFPTVIINVFSVTKDSLFSAFLTLFIVLTMEIIEETEDKFKHPIFVGTWVVVAFMTAIMRNNAVYIMILFLPVIILILRKTWKKMLLMISVVIVLYFLYSTILCPIFTVDGVSIREFISVPTQQMMRVYHEEQSNLSDEEIEIYELLFDEIAIEYYNPKISDVVKAHFNMDEFNANPLYYIRFYIEQGIRFPDVYINSFLHNTYGFWYPGARLALDPYGNEGYFVCHSRPPAEDNSRIPIIQKYYLLFEDSSVVYGASATVILFAPATFFWFLIIVLAQMIWKKRVSAIVVLTFVLFIWLTYLLGPVVLVRYVSFLYYIVPFEIALLVNNKRSI